MRVPFVKMSGAGNDMILIDHRVPLLAGRIPEFVRAACDRRFGIGADGVILLEDDAAADFAIRFFNPDGGEYELCGNGARCIPAFAAELGFAGPSYRFRSASGMHHGASAGLGSARVGLPPVRETRLDIEVDLEGRPARIDWGDIGVPHAAFWVDDVAAVPIGRWGPHLRSHRAFAPAGTNVSFVQVSGPDRLRIRTFERGVEGETFACGSGSTVAATIAHERNLVGRTVRLDVASGETLTVHLPAERGGGADLEGPVSRPYHGVADLDELLRRGPPSR
ncbi:MAG: diaminopimelate epimerase [Candidatus Eiseniibacteriota bacterium]